MTVEDLKKVRSNDDCVCVCDIATDTYLYDSYLYNNSTHDNVDYNVDYNVDDNVDDNVLDMTVCDIGTWDQFGFVIDVDTCIVC